MRERSSLLSATSQDQLDCLSLAIRISTMTGVISRDLKRTFAQLPAINKFSASQLATLQTTGSDVWSDLLRLQQSVQRMVGDLQNGFLHSPELTGLRLSQEITIHGPATGTPSNGS